MSDAAPEAASGAASGAAPGSASSAVRTQEAKTLDDVLLAMDVVDTLRHREQMVDRELDSEARESELISRLKEIYAAQGIDVPERILKDGVKALEEDRFVYRPPADSFAVRLARLYVTRGRWAPPAAALTGGAVALAAAYQFLWAAPRNTAWERFPSDVASVKEQGVDLAVSPDADASIEAMHAEALRLHAAGDRTAARYELARMEQVIERLAQEYEVRIVSRPGESTGVFRVPEAVPNGRNFYLVVEAVAPGGRVLSLPVTSEEDQSTKLVSKWGQRVTEEVYNRVADDKRDDQIVQNDVLGYKARGVLEPEYAGASPGGAIHTW